MRLVYTLDLVDTSSTVRVGECQGILSTDRYFRLVFQ